MTRKRSSRRRLIPIVAAGLLLALVFAWGYFLSSQLSQDVVRREAEVQLTKLMKGRTTVERASLSLRDGLRIEGQDARCYPSPTGPGLSVRHASARIDVLSLLAGKFRIKTLRLEGIHMEIERSVADRWTPYPINAIDTRGQNQDEDDLENKLGLLRVFESVARALLDKAIVAPEIEVVSSSVRMVDRYVHGSGNRPLDLRIEGIEGKLTHHWMNRSADLELRGTLVDEDGAHVPIEITGTRQSDGTLTLQLATTRLPLVDLRAYLQPQDPEARRIRAGKGVDSGPIPLTGFLSGVLSYENPEPEHGIFELDWVATDLDTAVRYGDRMLSLESPRANLQARLEMHPRRLRFSRIEFKGTDLDVEASGFIDRPLRESSSANFSVDFFGIGPDDLRRVAFALPTHEQIPMHRGLDRIEGGLIERIGARGKARFSTWREILSGDRLNLPESVEMSAELRDVAIIEDPQSPPNLTKLSAGLRWTGERFEFRDVRARWNGAPLPVLNLVVEGFPNLLLDYEHDARWGAGEIGPLSGVPLIQEIFFPPREDAAEHEGGLPTIQVEIDHFDHPAVTLPIRDARVQLDSGASGLEVRVERAVLGGAGVVGDMLFINAPERRLDARFRAMKPEQLPPVREVRRAVGVAALARAPMLSGTSSESPLLISPLRIFAPWASGRVYVDEFEGDAPLLQSIMGRFELRESQLHFSDVRAPLAPRGLLHADLVLDLSKRDFLDADFSFDVRDGEAGPLTHAVGFPEEFATGTLHFRGRLGGVLRPGEPLLREADGAVRLLGQNGEIRQSIPLVAALTHAIEGLDPKKANDAIQFESIETGLRFDHGRLSTDDFKLEGPLRVFISGDFDVARPSKGIQGEIGIFLFRQVDMIFGKVPVIKSLIPGGSEKGLFGAYFALGGTYEDPSLKSLTLKTLTDGILMPDLVKAPFAALRHALVDQSKQHTKSETAQREQRRDEEAAEAQKTPSPPAERPANIDAQVTP